MMYDLHVNTCSVVEIKGKPRYLEQLVTVRL